MTQKTEAISTQGTDTLYAVTVDTDQHAPRAFKGDIITADANLTPLPRDLAITWLNNDTWELIYYETHDRGKLMNGVSIIITNAHAVDSIKPGKDS